jgi:hypothetical protein
LAADHDVAVAVPPVDQCGPAKLSGSAAPGGDEQRVQAAPPVALRTAAVDVAANVCRNPSGRAVVDLFHLRRVVVGVRHDLNLLRPMFPDGLSVLVSTVTT